MEKKRKTHSGQKAHIDQVGRICLPIKMRRKLDIEPGGEVIVTLYENGIWLERYENACIFCGNVKFLGEYGGKKICAFCGPKVFKAVSGSRA